MVWGCRRNLSGAFHFTALCSQIFCLYPCFDLRDFSPSHESQYGGGIWGYVPVSSWSVLWGGSLCSRLDAHENLHARVDWFCRGACCGGGHRVDHRLVLCETDQALLRNASNFFGLTDLGDRFP